MVLMAVRAAAAAQVMRHLLQVAQVAQELPEAILVVMA
jgi:hypothetical protein